MKQMSLTMRYVLSLVKHEVKIGNAKQWYIEDGKLYVETEQAVCGGVQAMRCFPC